ncbi:hypothetical protein [Flavobacterium proteolyticum]|uniref:DGQHR domain-containing protein n=1 Tax=Flavobacterium proteolyticum TaxID=2911683 RepID=A0ABR9WTL8_9FLAO|nr:hypothetical protein [Flavobacterium proteolyticum]MBE9576991.1 hypothetical protein [Flavobacterium proteolyticum]
MIIRGILDRSLSSQLCIRGFAPIKELARISKADYSYQRNPIYEQQEVISTFLDNEDYLFFPEVILNYKVKIDYSKLKSSNRFSPLQELETKGFFKSNVDNTSIKTKKVIYKNSSDLRGVENIIVVELNLDDTILNDLIKKNQEPFSRVDGNHRLKAGGVAKSEKVNRMTIPFCIILSEELIYEEFKDGLINKTHEYLGEKFERVVFHNINTKTIPLTSEENLRVILDDEKNFSDEYLKEKFGWEYYAIRKVFKKLPKDLVNVYPNLGKDFLEKPRSVSKDIVKLLVDNKKVKRNESSISLVNEALKNVNQVFGNHPRLKNTKGIAFVVAATYLHISKENDIELFIKWLFKNHIDEIEGLTSKSLIKIYQKIRETKSKQVFVSMQFDEETKPHYNAIVKAVNEVNNEYNLEIKLREIRIDHFNIGHSYKIDDEILRLIEESGLLIADLSSKNINVYQELGYLMGLNQGKGLKQENFILIKKQDKKSKDTDIGFNIRPFQQLRFTSDLELVGMLKKSIVEYYELN